AVPRRTTGPRERVARGQQLLVRRSLAAHDDAARAHRLHAHRFLAAVEPALGRPPGGLHVLVPDPACDRDRGPADRALSANRGCLPPRRGSCAFTPRAEGRGALCFRAPRHVNPLTPSGGTMLLIREVMYCKPGKVRPLVEKFQAMSKLGEKSGMGK